MHRAGLRDATTFRNLLEGKAVPLEEKFPRLIERNLPYDQSKNKVRMEHRNARGNLWRLIRHNWFHVFLRWPTSHSLLVLICLWTSLILVFAGLYYWMDRLESSYECGLGSMPGIPTTYYGAFAFALETCTTVGYTLPYGTNAFFENCPGIQTVMYLQMVVSMLVNALIFAFMFARIAKSESRATQVVFSKSCVVRVTERNTLVCQFRVYDVAFGHGTVEAHVRAYALLKHKDDDGSPQLVQLRLISPNDELGATLFLSIPTVVTHQVDYYSPLYPKEERTTDLGYRLSSGGMMLREVDSVTGNREEVICPVCGESYGDFKRLRNHVRFNQLIEKKDDVPVEGSHRDLELEQVPRHSSRPTLAGLQEKLPLQELICVVEGIDPLTSGTFQALHSYAPEDIEWDARFVPCLTSKTSLTTTFVDLELFHQTEKVQKGPGAVQDSFFVSKHHAQQSEELLESKAGHNDDGEEKTEDAAIVDTENGNDEQV